MLKEFLQFDKMITASIIKFVFWIGSGLSVLIGLFVFFSGITATFGGGLRVFLGLVIMVVGPFLIRIYCELSIVFFKIYESLNDIKKEQQKVS